MKRHAICVLAATMMICGTAFAQPPAATDARPQRAAPVVSPEIGADGRATFRIRAPGVSEAAVNGFGAPLVMTKDAGGVWSATTPNALEPELYPYSFTLGGARVPDPANLTNTWAGAPTGGQAGTSQLYVPGQPWTNLDAKHGAVAKHVYASPIIGGQETYFVYTPPGYDPKRKKPYPVLVALHGLGNSAPDWIVQVGANLSLDTLIAEGKAEPMILVSPTSYGNTDGSRAAAKGFPSFTRALIEEILPQVEAQYNATQKASERAITGYSMGAAQSLLLLNHTDKFQWFGSLSPGFDMYHPGWGTSAVGPMQNGQRPPLPDGTLETLLPGLDSAKSRIRLLYLACGTADDHLIMTRQFKRLLDTKGIATTYVETEGAGHVFPYWRRQFVAFASVLFR